MTATEHKKAMKLKLLTLGRTYTDHATLLEGTLTHWYCDMSHQIYYLLQPKGLGADGQPIKKLIMELARISHSAEDIVEVDIPVEILGTEVRDKTSGFTGMAVELVQHIHGCVHVIIQPPGLVKSTGLPHKQTDFDLRDCVGEKIPTLSPAAHTESLVTRPSPCNTSFDHHEPSPFIQAADGSGR